MKSKKLFVTVFALSALLGVTSCGNGGDPEKNKVEFQFWCSFGQSVQEGVNSMITQFCEKVKAEEGIELSISLDYQGGYDDIYDKISQGLGTGNIPTLAVAYPDHIASYLQSGKEGGKQYVVNLDSYINDSKIGLGKEKYLGDINGSTAYGADDIVETFFEEGKQYSVAGTYSMPFMKSSEALFYNFDAVKRALKAGYKPEIADSDVLIKNYMSDISWDELVNFSRWILNNHTKVVNNLKSVIFYDSDSNLFISRMFQEEIPYSSQVDGHGHIDFKTGDNRIAAEGVVDSIANLAKETIDIDPSTGTKATLLTTKTIYGQYGSNMFSAEECIFSIGSTGGAGYNEPKTDVFTVEVAKVPEVNDNPLYVTQGPTLTILNNPSLSKEQNERKQLYAWKLLKYITNPGVNTELCIRDSQGYIPIRESAYTTDAYLDYLSQETIFAKTAGVMLSDISGNYLTTACFPGSSELRDYVGNTFASVVKGKTAHDALDEAINSAEAYFK